jgi:hypothetical protein
LGDFDIAVIQPAAIMLMVVGKPGDAVARAKADLGGAFNQ